MSHGPPRVRDDIVKSLMVIRWSLEHLETKKLPERDRTEWLTRAYVATEHVATKLNQVFGEPSGSGSSRVHQPSRGQENISGRED